MRHPLVIFLLFLLLGCAVRGPIKVPEFSVFSFTGIASAGDLPLPIQGALAKNGNELKFVLAARQGVTLGYGTINSDTGKIDLVFSQSGSVKRLLKMVGEALMELLPVIQEHKTASEHWIIEGNGLMRYKSSHLELNGHLQGPKN